MNTTLHLLHPVQRQRRSQIQLKIGVEVRDLQQLLMSRIRIMTYRSIMSNFMSLKYITKYIKNYLDLCQKIHVLNEYKSILHPTDFATSFMFSIFILIIFILDGTYNFYIIHCLASYHPNIFATCHDHGGK